MKYFKKAFNFITSFEFILVLYLFSGRFKGDPRFSWIPIDLTLLLFILLAIISLYLFLIKNNKIKIKSSEGIFIGVYFVFIVYINMSLLWSSSSYYAIEKTRDFSILTFIAFCYIALIVSQSKIRVKRFLHSIVLISLWIGWENFVLYMSNENIQFINVLGGNYLAIGRTISIATIVVFFTMRFARDIKIRLLSFITFCFFIYLLLILGGRGPLISVLIPILSLITIETFKLKIPRINVVLIPLLMVCVFVAVILFATSNKNFDDFSTLERLLYTAEEGFNSNSRSYLYSKAIEIWHENPFIGGGIGSYPTEAGLGDYRFYPHNMFLEILSENGLIGLAIKILLLLSVFIVIKSNNSRLSGLFVLLILNLFINSMLSGDYNDNRVYWAILGLALYKSEEKKLENITFNNCSSNKRW